MKKIFTILALSTLFFSSNVFAQKAKVKWLSWEEATSLENTEGKKYFVDLYTTWCGYCKKMDRTTFQDPSVIEYINKNFIPIKLDAEQKEDIQYKGYTLTYQKDVGRKGMHEMAMALLEGVDRIGYPTYVYLDKDQNRITISPGYKPKDDMLMELKFISEDHYIDTSFQEFAQKYN